MPSDEDLPSDLCGLPALTVQQLFAELIVRGVKTIENRTWYTSHRGPLVIHAGTSTRVYRSDFPAFLGRVRAANAQHELDALAPIGDLPRGAILGTVDLIDVCRLEDTYDSPWAVGPWCWIVSDPRRLDAPIPRTGGRGLWGVRMASGGRSSGR